MALSLQLGFPDVPNSITNPNVKIKDSIDSRGPMSFLTFIKTITVSFEPDSLQNYYNYYLKIWNNQSKNKTQSETELIVEKYKEFLRDISLDYTTLEEKKFLSNIDFNDPLDLDVVIGFYSRKLVEISREYNDQRNDVKYNIIRSKLRGTNFGTERTIFELTLSYLKNLDDGKILFDYDSIKSKLEVEIEELYDVFPSYYNNIPDETEYGAKDLDYGYDIFLKSNQELISTIFAGVSEDLIALKELDQLFDNKRKSTEKYMATDFYYLSTGKTVTDFLSGKLFNADKPSSNFLNRNYPSVPSKQRKESLRSEREVGFFKPSNTTIVLVDGEKSSFSFNFDALEPNSLYYFPDPNLIGTNDKILTFIVNDGFLRRNITSGNATNQPVSTPFDTKYYGYVSKTELSRNKYLDTIFDSGFVSDTKKDIYNNLFGLFRDNFKYRDVVTSPPSESLFGKLIDGYKFYDDLYGEGLNFDYSIFDNTTYNETTRSGLSTFTGTFDSSEPEVTLFFGFFKPYNELPSPTEPHLVETYEILEGAFILKSDGSFYEDTVSSDLSAFELSDGPFYYTDLIEGGLYTSDTRALLDPLYPDNQADLTVNPRGENIQLVDGGSLSNAPEFVLELETSKYGFDDTPPISSIYSPNTHPKENYPNWELEGILYVRNSETREIATLLDSLPYLSTKYSPSIVNNLEYNIKKFEICNDILFIETPSHLIIDKILFERGKFIDPRTVPIYVSHSQGEFDKISNRFKVKQKVYYTILRKTGSGNNFNIYPEIYEFDLINFKNTLIFPRTSTQITDYFSVYGGDVRYTSSDTPVLVHNSRNNIFSVAFLKKDQNSMFSLGEYDFVLDPDVRFINHKSLQPNYLAFSNIFDDSYSTNLYIFLNSGTFTTTQEELIW